jgi:hypothetical protein
VVIVLVPIATSVGLFAPAFYRDTAWSIPQARGQDLITLVVVEPLLIAAVLGARRSRAAAPLLWLGTLAYILYTYAMYSYTTYFNALFLVYTTLFSTSLFALISLLISFDPEWVRAAIHPGMPIRTVAGYLAFVGVFFLAAWMGQIVPALLQGTVPTPVTLAKTPTSAVHVQDLAVVIPLFFAAAVWLWQRRSWGIVLAGILLLLADIMLVALLAMGQFMARAGIAGGLDMFWVFVILTIVSFVLTGLFFMHLGRPAVVTGGAVAEQSREGEPSGTDTSALHPTRAEQSPAPRSVAGRC